MRVALTERWIVERTPLSVGFDFFRPERWPDIRINLALDHLHARVPSNGRPAVSSEMEMTGGIVPPRKTSGLAGLASVALP